MNRKSRVPGGSDCPRMVKKIGWELIACAALGLFLALNAIHNMGTVGELGRGVHEMVPLYLCLGAWGLGTGVGVLRAWRWARISMLILSSFPIVFGALLAGVLLFLPKGDMSAWGLVLMKTVAILITLVPVAVGVRWFKYFRRNDVKSYFRASVKTTVAAG